MTVQVSCIMPSYNHEMYIGKAIESVLVQSMGDFELIIVDDGSKDNSRDVIERYEVEDHRIRTVYHSRNFGIARTMNDGIDKAKGKFVAFIDSDDLWTESKLERQLSLLKKNENLILWSEGELIDGKDNKFGEGFVKLFGAENKRKSGNILKDLFLYNFIFGSSLILKRESAAKIRFNHVLKYLNDYLFVVELAEHFTYYFIKEPLSKYRIHGKNSVSRDQENWYKDYILIRQIFLRKYRNEMSRSTKAYNLFEIARNYALLKRMKEARLFAVQALIASGWVHKQSLFYFANFIGYHALRKKFIWPLFGSTDSKTLSS